MKFTPDQLLKFKYQTASGPKMQDAIVCHVSKNMLAVSASMFQRGCEIDGSGYDDCPNITISLDDGLMSVIEFPELAGWNVWAVHACKYTVRICFVKV